MNKLQHRLIKLAEECTEVAQMALKTAQFGLDETYQDLDNRTRLNAELTDLYAAVDELNRDHSLGFIPAWESIDKKQKKVEHFWQYTINLGLGADS